MPYSKDPMNYLDEERALMLAALGTTMRLVFSTHKQAYNQRSRLYGLRAAVATAYEKLQALEKKGADTRGYDDEIIRAAPAIRSIGVRYEDAGKTVLIVERGGGIAPDVKNALQAALHNAGVATPKEKQEQDLNAMMKRLKDVKPDDDSEPSLADLGFTTGQEEEE